MRLRVQHKTVYRYAEPISYSVQALRLTPQAHQGMAVIRWAVRTASRKALPSFVDGFGNLTHTISTAKPHGELSVSVEGEVETQETHGVIRGATETLPPAFFMRLTPHTTAEAEVLALIAAIGPKGNSLTRLHRLMSEIHRRVEYRTGVTDTATTAAEALRQGSGVCQDHAHAFIAAARQMGYPARYVSGYLWTQDAADGVDAGHAWAEAFVEDLGWVGFDAANGICPTEAYIRCAIGLDYWSASPVRGIWRGDAEEYLSVRVKVDQIGAEQ